MNWKQIKKPSRPFLSIIIILLLGVAVILAIHAKTALIQECAAIKQLDIARKDATKSREQFNTLFAKCSTLEKQCTQAKKIRELQEEALFTYIRTKYTRISEMVAREIAKQTVQICAEKDAPFTIVVGIMEVESSFNPTVVSKAGARGLMQVMPNIWVKKLKYLSGARDLHEIKPGIEAGIDVYLHYYNAVKSTSGALGKYFGASNKGYQEKVYKAISQFTFHMVERGQTL